MKTKPSIYLKIVLLVIVYYAILNGLTLLLFHSIKTDFFDTIFKIHLIELLPVVITMTLVFFFYKKSVGTKRFNVNAKYLIIALIFAFLIRLFNDPIYRFLELFDYKEIPSNIPNSSFIISDQSLFVLKVIILIPILEEVFFRGVLLHLLKNKIKSNIIGVLISSILFALIHITPVSIKYTTIITAFTFGIVASIIYLKYGLLYAIALHMIHNLLWLIIRENRLFYFDMLREMNFGVLYWGIVLTSLLLMIYIFKKQAT